MVHVFNGSQPHALFSTLGVVTTLTRGALIEATPSPRLGMVWLAKVVEGGQQISPRPAEGVASLRAPPVYLRITIPNTITPERFG
ncbi:hypothetical protein HOY80DRAFT_1054392 [Tuber brumale]|nr:hypothetical protein HOY80DRAFT_1054392 [Tuber brumale]